MNKKLCRGCNAFCNPPSPYTSTEKIEIGCPCVNCLVKTTCKQICHEFAMWDINKSLLRGVPLNKIAARRIVDRPIDPKELQRVFIVYYDPYAPKNSPLKEQKFNLHPNNYGFEE